MLADIALIAGAYLLGSLPQVYWLGRLRGVDLSREGELHQVLWKLDHKLGAIGFVADLAKGPIAILAGHGLSLPLETVAVAGVMVMVGQMWPVYLLRSGGGGNTIGTMAAALAIYPFLIALIPVLVGVGWRMIGHRRRGYSPLGPPSSRSLPLGMAIAFAVLPAASWGLGEPKAVTLAFVGLLVAIIIRRLTKGLLSELKATPLTARSALSRLFFDRPYLGKAQSP